MLEFEGRLPVVEGWTVALNEVFVRVGGVKLDERDAPVWRGEKRSECLRDERLPGAGRPLKDHLPLVVEQPLDLLEERDWEAQLLGKPGETRRFGWVLVLFGLVLVASDDCPHDRLGVEAVAQVQTALRRLVDEPVEEAECVVVQRRLVGVVVGRLAYPVRWYASSNNVVLKGGYR